MLEDPAVAAQPGLNPLISHQFSVLVPTPGQLRIPVNVNTYSGLT